MTPPIWIFAYHVALLMGIFIVSLKHRDRQSRRRRASQDTATQSLNNPNQYVQINENNEEEEVREEAPRRDSQDSNENKESSIFGTSYRRDYDKSDIFMKIAFNTILVMEFGLSITILVLVFMPSL